MRRSPVSFVVVTFICDLKNVGLDMLRVSVYIITMVTTALPELLLRRELLLTERYALTLWVVSLLSPSLVELQSSKQRAV